VLDLRLRQRKEERDAQRKKKIPKKKNLTDTRRKLKESNMKKTRVKKRISW